MSNVTKVQHTLIDYHFKKFPQLEICPACQSKKWVPAAISFASWCDATDLNALKKHDMQGTPILLVACNDCFSVRSFVWVGIARTAKPLVLKPEDTH